MKRCAGSSAVIPLRTTLSRTTISRIRYVGARGLTITSIIGKTTYSSQKISYHFTNTYAISHIDWQLWHKT